MSKRGGSSPGGGTKQVNKVEEYTTFSDTAKSDTEYNGTGLEATQFFKENSNYEEIIKQMDEDDTCAFYMWSQGAFMGGEIYQGFDALPMYDDFRDWQYSLDKSIDQSTLSKGVQVVRLSDAQLVLGKGNIKPTLEALQAMEGRVVFSAGNMSTAAASQGLTIGDLSKQVEYKIKIPSGSTGAGMWIGDKRLSSWDNRQREFITNRDTNWQVGKTVYNSARKIYEVELTYVSRNSHDYGSWKK